MTMLVLVNHGVSQLIKANVLGPLRNVIPKPLTRHSFTDRAYFKLTFVGGSNIEQSDKIENFHSSNPRESDPNIKVSWLVNPNTAFIQLPFKTLEPIIEIIESDSMYS